MLSEHPIAREIVLISERKYRDDSAYAVNTFEILAYQAARDRFICSTLIIDIATTAYCSRNRHATARYQGNNTWHSHRHFDISWNRKSNYTRIV
jgi:hypothetical protein